MGHDIDHPHDHDASPGEFEHRPPPLRRDFARRAFTVGIGGPVGSGKTALVLALCRALRDRVRLGVVTNDIFTREDAEFLTRHEALPLDRIRAVETGGCPHAAIREDVSMNLAAIDTLLERFPDLDLVLVESGGDKVPRKGGPGITQSDLLIINKTDLAPLVGADLGVMERDARRMRGDGPFVFAQAAKGVGIDQISEHILSSWKQAVQVG